MEDYDKKKYKIWDWKHPFIMLWIINPLVAFNELILGQTIPKIMLIEREGNKPYYQRNLVPCPHCNTLHSGIKWSSQNKTAYKNWYGFYCDNCAGIIPVQRNLTSLLILTVTFPLWGWFRKYLKQRWLDKQPERFKDLNLVIDEKKNTTKNWLKSGLYFGLYMYVIMVIIFPLIEKETITWKRLLISIPFWLLCGLGWGYTMKIWMNKKGKIKKVPNNITK